MKFVVGVLFLLAVSRAADVKTPSRRSQKTEDSKTDKRELAEGNSGVQKRAPLLVSASPTPGIEYVDTTESHQDKSPAQQIYATPVPQVAKISDVLTGQGVPFPVAIASHLYSPVSIYQPRLGSPTTYEVSQPIPSQLAYSEHKIYQPPLQNVQYFTAQKQQSAPKQNNFARLTILNQQPNVYVPQQQLLYTQQQNQSPQPQQVYQYIPQVYQQQPQVTYSQNQVQQPLPYQNSQISYTQSQSQQPQVYSQNPEPLVQYIAPVQAPVSFERLRAQSQYNSQQQYHSQREQKNIHPTQQRAPEKQILLPQQAQNERQTSSFASLSQTQPSPNYAPQTNYVQPSIQYAQKVESAVANPLPALPKPQQPIYTQVQDQSYQSYQPQVYQQQPIYPQGQILVQNPGYQQQPLAAAPTFPPVQYFGKFAQSIFGGYQQ